MQGWVKAIVAQTVGEIRNITGSMGFSIDMGGKKVFTPLSEYYQKNLDRACLDIVTGSFDYNTVLRRVVREMTASGIRTVDYASGHTDRVTVASRRAVMSGVWQLCSQINEMTANELGTDSYEIDWHSGARPSHWWGGMVFTMDNLKTVCGLGTGPGLGGWNCYHIYHAFVPGVSVRTYNDAQLAALNAKDKEIRTWNGKEYNAYDAGQQQRHMENIMRKQRADVRLLEAGKADFDTVQAAKTKYLDKLHEYQMFCKKMQLPEQMPRVYMDGLGRVANNPYFSKKKSTSTPGRGIINNNRRIPQIPASTIAKKVESGEYSLKLSTQQFEKHVFGSPKYMEYRQTREAKGGNPQSILTISQGEGQEIINNKHGTGIVKVDRQGNARPIENITCDKVIGQYYAKGQFHDTDKAAIHYGKKSSHIVPIRGDDYD